MESVLEFKHISKYFPGVRTLDNICFQAFNGEVLAFLDENGAGKPTLLKVLNGDYQPDEGKYWLDGKRRHFKSPQEAIGAGIGVIYQERQILMELSMAENIYLGRMPVNKLGVINMKEANRMTGETIEDFGLPIKPGAKVKGLSIAYQQMVEIMKAYSRDGLKVICFDEPTASLSDPEIDSLFSIIEKLKSGGKIIIYVSHRMNEAQRIADKVTIFKDGRHVNTVVTGEVPESEMIKMMVGRDLGDTYENLDRNKEIREVLLDVRNVSSDYVKPTSFQLRRGEVLGFSGLVGAGRTEVVRAIIGADHLRSGEVWLEGRKIVSRSPKDAMDNDIALVLENRKVQGILANLNVSGNVNISMLDRSSNKLRIVSSKKEAEAADQGIRDFRIKTPSPDKKIVELSGGSQQKCIVVKWLTTNPKVLILDEPTKGIDVGTKFEFYNMICSFAKQGLGVILTSSELPEVIGLSGRIIVMKSLKIFGKASREETAESKLLSLEMIGENES